MDIPYNDVPYIYIFDSINNNYINNNYINNDYINNDYINNDYINNDYNALDDNYNYDNILLNYLLAILLTAPTQEPINEPINPVQENDTNQVISDAAKNSLITLKYKDLENKESYTTCPIMLQDFTDDDEIIQLPCKHCFTSTSILNWLTTKSCKCPVCRHKMESKPTPTNVPTNDLTNNNYQYRYIFY